MSARHQSELEEVAIEMPEQSGARSDSIAEDNPVVCVGCKKWSLCKLLAALLSSVLGMFVFFFIGIFIALFILPALQMGLLFNIKCCGCGSVDDTIKTLRCQYSRKCCRYWDGFYVYKSWYSETLSLCRYACKSVLAIFEIIWHLIGLVLYLGLGIVSVVGAAAWGLVWCPWIGMIVGMVALPQIVWKMMSGKMHKDTVYRTLENALVWLQLLVVDKGTYSPGKGFLNRRVDGSATFFWMLATSAHFVIAASLCALSLRSFDDVNILLILYFLGLPLMARTLHKAYTSRLIDIEMEFKEENTEVGDDDDKVKTFKDKYIELINEAQEQRLQNAGLLSPEEEYWVIMAFLLIDEGTIWVRRILLDHIRSVEMDAQEFFLQFKDIIHEYCQGSGKGRRAGKGRRVCPKLLSNEQFHQIYPPCDSSYIQMETFDLVLLITLIAILRIRPEPACGWSARKYEDIIDPEDDDQPRKDAANLVRMRWMRKMIFSHECKLSKEDFDRYYPELQEILKSFGARIEEMTAERLRRATENREDYVNRITTLFTAGVYDAKQFAEKKENEIAENHKPRSPQPASQGFRMYMTSADGTLHEL